MGRLNKKKLSTRAFNKCNESFGVTDSIATANTKKLLPVMMDENLVKLKSKKTVNQPSVLLLKKPILKVNKGVHQNSLFGVSSESKMAKKDKMKLKRELLRTKLAQDAAKRKEERATVERQKRPVVGDMNPLKDALMAIDDTLTRDAEVKRKSINKKSTKSKSKSTLKQKERQAEFLKNVSLFNQVKKHPEFSKDPFQTISTHIENKMLLEALGE